MKVLTITAFIIAAALCVAPANALDDLVELRSKYKQAKLARDSGRTTEYRSLKEELREYPLFVYLEYHEAIARLSSHTPDRALEIKERLSESVLSEEFFQRWLDAQAKAGRWQTYTTYYIPSTDAAEQCRYLNALNRIGQRELALSLVPSLWIVGVSQPKECDPIFGTWINNGNVTPEIAWQRLQLAVAEDSLVLARYLMRFFPPAERSRAQLLYDVHVRPGLVKNIRRFSDDEWGRKALVHGLREFAIDNGIESRELWDEYHPQFSFDDETILQTDSHLAFWAAREGQLVLPINQEFDAQTIERVADAAMALEQWHWAHQWLEQYPDAQQSSYKWRFWSSILKLKLGREEAQSSLEDLATERTYYGFLAADELGLPIQLNGFVWPNPKEQREKYLQDPRIARIFELYALGDQASAKKEWRWLLPQIDQDAKSWIAHEIANIGWTYDAIQAAFSADAFDLIDARFPILYMDAFKRNAHMTNISLPVLLAITRQESAFNANAVSPVGARGLMQLMLPTARRTASNIRTGRPSPTSLLDPATNIYLGSHHFVELLEEFHDNRVLAFAAYNAGSHRVREWIKNSRGMDTRVWIETIPFGETRNYVKNVIAFTQVYSQILDIPVPVLEDHERTIP